MQAGELPGGTVRPDQGEVKVGDVLVRIGPDGKFRSAAIPNAGFRPTGILLIEGAGKPVPLPIAFGDTGIVLWNDADGRLAAVQCE